MLLRLVRWLISVLQRLEAHLSRGLPVKPNEPQSTSVKTLLDGLDPCQLFVDRVDDLALQLDALIALIQLAVADLIACREEHPENPPPPMAPMPSETQPAYSREYKRAFAANLIDQIKTFRKMLK